MEPEGNANDASWAEKTGAGLACQPRAIPYGNRLGHRLIDGAVEVEFTPNDKRLKPGTNVLGLACSSGEPASVLGIDCREECIL